MNLFIIHCGFYDEEISEGVYEFHVNIPIVAHDLEEAKNKVKIHPMFKSKKMHIDGIHELRTVEGYSINVN